MVLGTWTPPEQQAAELAAEYLLIQDGSVLDALNMAEDIIEFDLREQVIEWLESQETNEEEHERDFTAYEMGETSDGMW